MGPLHLVQGIFTLGFRLVELLVPVHRELLQELNGAATLHLRSIRIPLYGLALLDVILSALFRSIIIFQPQP